MDAAELQQLAGLPFPFYVRKLDKKSSWGHESDVAEDRSAAAVKAVFDPSKLRFSLYLINNFEDLTRVTVGINAGRHRLNDQVDYVAFATDEFDLAEIELLDDVLGETPCFAANSLHVDVRAGEYSAFGKLCSDVIAKSRSAFRITKGKAKEMVSSMEKFGCVAFGETDSKCPCM